jgi:hypothetical protein
MIATNPDQFDPQRAVAPRAGRGAIAVASAANG